MSPSDDNVYTVRWRKSIILRVIVLCVILFVCLLASVSALTRYSFHQIAQARTSDIARTLQLHMSDTTEPIDFERLRAEMLAQDDALSELQIHDREAASETTEIYVGPQGNIIVRNHTQVYYAGQPMTLEASFALSPLTPFQDRLLLAITGLFTGALALLIYIIYRTLRPLRELSNRLAMIGEGNLEEIDMPRSGDELTALGDTFNRMVNSLREKEVVEANLRQAQRLSALGTLAAGVAHDIRNPLNAIKLLSSHASDTLSKNGAPESAKRQVGTIRTEVDRLEGIVSSFLSLAKEHELRPEPCIVDELVAECARLVEKDAEDRGVRLTSDLRAGETTLMLDPKHWKRAVLNVLINALEATPEGGRVRLFSRLIGADVTIEVRDDGPGIPPEVAERIFDPYYTTKPTGTGLGLSITRGIVEEHGGEISVMSNDGCQVLITLPLEAPVL